MYILYQDYNLCLCFASKCVTIKQVRGISAAGSAFEWHSRGRGFESHLLHDKTQGCWPCVVLFVGGGNAVKEGTLGQGDGDDRGWGADSGPKRY